jgi:hypothetical protein
MNIQPYQPNGLAFVSQLSEAGIVIGAGLARFKETRDFGKGLAAFSAFVRLLCLLAEIADSFDQRNR